MNITVRSHHLAALTACIRPDNARQFLDGLWIDPEREKLIATDGRVLLAVPMVIDDLEPASDQDRAFCETHILPPVRVPRRKEPFRVVVEINPDESPSVQLAYPDLDAQAESCRATPLSNSKRLPDWTRVAKLADFTPLTQLPDRFPAFNPSLLSPIGKALKAPGCRLEYPADPLDPVRVHWYAEPDLYCVLMPVHNG
jgi:hypothetical protein